MELKKRLSEWIKERPNLEAILWFIVALGCIALLVWFLAFSGFDNPPEFVYEQF